MKLKPSIVVWTILSAAVVYLLGYLLFPSAKVPEEFSEARQNGAAVAVRILELSGNTLAKLNEIAEQDKNYNFSEALLLISQQLIANRENNLEAVKLSSQLERMARFVPDVRPAGAREVATEGVSAGVALVSHLLSYNEYLKQLFEILKQKFEKPWVSTDGQVQFLIKKINEEVQAVNELNGRFVASMQNFDKIIEE